jgi:hypothetical protein
VGFLRSDGTKRQQNQAFSRNSLSTENLRPSDFFIVLRPLASVCGFCQRDDTQNDTQLFVRLLMRSTHAIEASHHEGVTTSIR